MPRLARLALCIAVVLQGAGCAPEPRDPSDAWKDYEPKTPLPAFARLLGRPCEKDWRTDELFTRCGKGQRISIAVLSNYSAVTGKKSVKFEPQSYDEWSRDRQADYDFDDTEAPRSLEYPKNPLAWATLARSGKDVNERVLWVDGPYLWIRVVTEVGEQFPWARLVVADRRLLTPDDRAIVAEALALRVESDINDDETLRRAVMAQARVRSSGPK